jgi:hypothetical protein
MNFAELFASDFELMIARAFRPALGAWGTAAAARLAIFVAWHAMIV